ncbi:MAG: Maf family nucleotide pyrophosphatase [Bifidobacteriaceae bacterium]|nr:Maf family nucleotide pyrophosphatase [Bifidobacteriaceae bacterium]
MSISGTSIPVILASQSRPRRNLLVQSGILPLIRVSQVDEPAALRTAAEKRGLAGVDAIAPADQVQILADAKAMAISSTYEQIARTARSATGELVESRPLEDGFGTVSRTMPIREALRTHEGMIAAARGPLVIGCDSMFEFDGHVYGKPHEPQVARERLRAMSGGEGTLWTGHCVVDVATGKTVHATSRATVRFAPLSDAQIDAYIASGEPLQVAGCFTLEGLGGPFIDSIDGDPSGIIGLSLPTVRRLVEQLGFAWTDLWNLVTPGGVHPGVPLEDREHDTDAFKNAATSSAAAGDSQTADPAKKPPKDNVHQPGDGWVDCPCGHRHWGRNGASGVLLARRDATSGEVTQVLLQHRALWSAEGGTWGAPGGATADGESPLEGALRESFEEANIHPEDIDVVGAYRESHGAWSYTTVLAFEKPGHTVIPRANDDESLETCWVSVPAVDNLTLLSAMRQDWDGLIARLRAISKSML